MHHAAQRGDVGRRRINAHADDRKLGPRTPYRLLFAKAAGEGRLNYEGLEVVKRIALREPHKMGVCPTRATM